MNGVKKEEKNLFQVRNELFVCLFVCFFSFQ
jgi:hypothetical protein